MYIYIYIYIYICIYIYIYIRPLPSVLPWSCKTQNTCVLQDTMCLSCHRQTHVWQDRCLARNMCFAMVLPCKTQKQRHRLINKNTQTKTRTRTQAHQTNTHTHTHKHRESAMVLPSILPFRRCCIANAMQRAKMQRAMARPMSIPMGWLRLVGSLNLQVSFAEYSLF